MWLTGTIDPNQWSSLWSTHLSMVKRTALFLRLHLIHAQSVCQYTFCFKWHILSQHSIHYAFGHGYGLVGKICQISFRDSFPRTLATMHVLSIGPDFLQKNPCCENGARCNKHNGNAWKPRTRRVWGRNRAFVRPVTPASRCRACIGTWGGSRVCVSQIVYAHWTADGHRRMKRPNLLNLLRRRQPMNPTRHRQNRQHQRPPVIPTPAVRHVDDMAWFIPSIVVWPSCDRLVWLGILVHDGYCCDCTRSHQSHWLGYRKDRYCAPFCQNMW